MDAPQALPPRSEMLVALERRDATYEGVFITAVKTTGVFCRPGCPARLPKPENVEFFPRAHDALFAGYRPCRRCRPLEVRGETPAWLRPLLEAVDREPERRFVDRDLVGFGVDPARVRRWFQANHGMTFHGYLRGRRLGLAMGQLRHGAGVLDAGLDHGYRSASGLRRHFNGSWGRVRAAPRRCPPA